MRRVQVQPSTGPARVAAPRTRSARFPAIVVVVVAVVAAVVIATRGAASGAGPVEPVPPGRTITYALVDSAGSRTTEVVDLLRPVTARTRTFQTPDGAPDGTLGPLLGGSQWTPGALISLVPDGSARTVQPRAPVAVPVDPRPDLVLAAHTGLAVRGSMSAVLGMACMLWTTLNPLDGGPLAAATADQSTTSCVTADGLVLRDVLTLHGTTARTRTATSVVPLASLPVPDAAPVPAGFRVLAVEPGAPPAGSPYPALPPTGPSGEPPAATVQTATFSGQADDPATGESAVRTYLDTAGHLTTLEVSRDLTGAPAVVPASGLQAVTAGVSVARLLTRDGSTFTVRATTDGSSAHLASWLASLR